MQHNNSISDFSCIFILIQTNADRLNSDSRWPAVHWRSLCLQILVTTDVWYWWSLIVQFLIVFTLVDHTPISLGHYVYPDWADGIGWLMFTVVVLMIPLIAVIEIVCARHAHPFLSISVSHHSVITSECKECGMKCIPGVLSLSQRRLAI